jgi:D-glycero-alpha-D-manno-heptose-7-phosphate kinase
VIIASAPTRLDFGGGWTDVPPYPEERGGFVCNLAIERRAVVTLQPDQAGAHVAEPLVAAALSGAGLGAARVSLASQFPVGAGLGGSSAAGVALAAAIAAARGTPLDPATLAEQSRAVEVGALGIAGGFQDHYAAAFGGALGLTFGAGTRVERIPLPAETMAALEARIVLVYTGESRMSGDTITAVLDAYRLREPRVVSALDRMALLARGMRGALHAGDVSLLAALVDEHWSHQKSLHPRITTGRIDALEAAVRRAGATGFKALGASGGGCIMALAPVGAVPAVREAAADLGDVLEWRVATEGVVVHLSGASPAA